MTKTVYGETGVDIDAGNRAIALMREAVKTTYGKQVLAGIGSFGGLYDAAAFKEMHAPVLVASTDGVGTKVALAVQAHHYSSIGYDIVNHCVNDILVQGAQPLFFLDYVATGKLDPETIAEIVKGIAAACRKCGCALIGGETAEMPGIYEQHAFDLAGTIVGLVERKDVLPRRDIRVGDVLVGLHSSGPHTNGYSLIRKVFEGVALDTVFPTLGIPLGEALLAPHRSYLPVLQHALADNRLPIKGLAHITGGGFVENIPRVLPDGVGAVINPDSWTVPPIFRLIQERGGVSTAEMYRVFNMGIGMVAIVAWEDVTTLQALVGETTYVIGELVAGEKKVTLADNHAQ